MTFSFFSRTASTNSSPECHAFKSYLSPTDFSKSIYCSPESALMKTMHKSASPATSLALSISSFPTTIVRSSITSALSIISFELIIFIPSFSALALIAVNGSTV